MKFYSFSDIRAAGDCAALAKDVFNATIKKGRCNASWRGGDGPENVSIDKDKWFDHVQKQGGGIIELAAYKFNGDIQQAQSFLGELYHLTPRMGIEPQPAQGGRYSDLISDGYKEVARYRYRDQDGNVIHHVARLEHDSRHKQFCQGTPKGWGLRDTEPILYNLAAIAKSSWACIVEGEKVADLLISHGIPATTCCGGAGKWHSRYNEILRGKAVAVLPDNDLPGLEHAKAIAESLSGIASTIKIVPTSDKPKGDAYDYLTTEGHDDVDLMALIKAASSVTSSTFDLADTTTSEPNDTEIRIAKAANKIPFRNFIPGKPKKADQAPKRKTAAPIKKPRLIQDLIDDCHSRFIGFPRKVGEQLFDHDLESNRIVEIYKSSELFAWIGRKSKNHTEWTRGDSFTTKDEFMAGLSAAAIRYEAISSVPDWPKRDDVYYSHDTMPAPCPNRSRFKTVVRAFAPATSEDLTFLKAFIIAPLWYRYGIPKPSWVIDSEDGAGTGKSTIAEIVAYLYMGEPIRTNRQELRMGIQELIKRMVSSHGRQQRMILVDNITGQFSCPELADLITAQSISGRAPYGHGEETRPNNLVFVMTANTATVDNDIADRSYYINIKRPSRDPDWKPNILKYIAEHRFEIISDIIAILNDPDKTEAQAQTRFPEFETQILQAVCEDHEEYQEAIYHLNNCKMDTNIEDEQAKVIEDTLREKLAESGVHPDMNSAFIRTPVIEYWLDGILERQTYSGGLVQHVRNLVKMNLIPTIDGKTKRWPSHGKERRSGFMWNFKKGEKPKTVLMKGRSNVEIRL